MSAKYDGVDSIEDFYDAFSKIYLYLDWKEWTEGLVKLTSIIFKQNLSVSTQIQRFFEFRVIPQMERGSRGSRHRSWSGVVQHFQNNPQLIDEVLNYLGDKSKGNYSINQTRFIDLLARINYQKYGVPSSLQSRVLISIMNVLNDIETRPLRKLWIWYAVMEIRGIDNLQEVLDISQLCEDITVHPEITIKLFECIGESGDEDYLDFLIDYDAQKYQYNEKEKIMIAVVDAIGKIGGDKSRNYLRNGFDEGKAPGKWVYARSLSSLHDDYVIDYFVNLALEREFPEGPIEELRRINSLLSNEILRSLMAENRKKHVRRKVAAAIALMKNSDLEAIRVLIPFANRGSFTGSTKSDHVHRAAREAICRNENPENLNILLQEQNENWYWIRNELGQIADRELPEPYIGWEEEKKIHDYITRFIDPVSSEQLKPTLTDMLGHIDPSAVLAACHYIGINRIKGFEGNLWNLSKRSEKNISLKASIALIELGDYRILDETRKQINDGTVKSHLSSIQILTTTNDVSTIEELILLSKLYVRSKFAMKLIIRSWVEMEVEDPEHIHSIGVVLKKLERDLRKEIKRESGGTSYDDWDEIEKLAGFGTEKIVNKRKQLTFENFEKEKRKEEEEIRRSMRDKSREKRKKLREQRAKNLDVHDLEVSDSQLELILEIIQGEPTTISKDSLKNLTNDLISKILASKHATDFKENFDKIRHRDDIWPNLIARIDLRINDQI